VGNRSASLGGTQRTFDVRLHVRASPRYAVNLFEPID
jgi:hypothetical protein